MPPSFTHTKSEGRSRVGGAHHVDQKLVDYGLGNRHGELPPCPWKPMTCGSVIDRVSAVSRCILTNLEIRSLLENGLKLIVPLYAFTLMRAWQGP